MDKDPEITNSNVEKTYTDPVTGKFVKGNPGGGRPVGSLDFKTKWYKMIDKIAEANDITADEVELELVKVGYKRAKEGDYSFYRDAMDRIHGKPLQHTDITTNGKDLPIPILGNVSNNNSNTENSETQKED